MKHVWTFMISRGNPFEIRVPGGRPLSHDGGQGTIWQVLCTGEEAELFAYTIRGQGCQVQTSFDTPPPSRMGCQEAKEEAAKIAAESLHGGVVRRGLEIWLFHPDGQESLVVRSDTHKHLWQRALAELQPLRK